MKTHMQRLAIVLLSLTAIAYAHAQTVPALLLQYPNYPPTHPDSSDGVVPPLLVTLFTLFWLLFMIGLSIMVVLGLAMDFAKHTATVRSVIIGVLSFATTSTLAGVIAYHLFFM